MGIVHLPSPYDYWKNDEVYHYSPIPRRISRNRFLELHRYLHFVNNSHISPPGTPDYDRLDDPGSEDSDTDESYPDDEKRLDQ